MNQAVEEDRSVLAERVRQLEPAPPLSLVAALNIRATCLLADWTAAFLVVLGAHAAALVVAPGELHADLVLAIPTFTVLALHASGAYRTLEGPCHVEEVAAVVSAVAASLLSVLAAVLLFHECARSLVLIAIDFPVLLAALVAERLVVSGLLHRWSERRLAPVLVYGAGTTGRLMAQRLLHETALGFRPVGFLDDAPELAGASVRTGEGEAGVRLPVLGSEEALADVVGRTRAAAVFVAIPSTSSARIEAILRRLEAVRVPVFFVPSAGERPIASLRVVTLGGIPVLAPRRPLRLAAYTVAKRVMDVVLASALLVLVGPFVLAGMLLVRLTSPGPAIFKQERVGLGGRTFTIYKLRTMRSDTAAYAYHPESASDARITTVGRWLRRTSLDELPQLWNILAGDMSFVGPRPEMPFIAATYNATQLQRLLVKPGLTGLWQVSADRAFKIHDNVFYDLYYVERRSLAMDVAILILTPFLLFAQRAAK